MENRTESLKVMLMEYLLKATRLGLHSACLRSVSRLGKPTVYLRMVTLTERQTASLRSVNRKVTRMAFLRWVSHLGCSMGRPHTHARQHPTLTRGCSP